MRNLGFIWLLFFSTNLWSAEPVASGFYAGGTMGFAELDDDSMGDNQDFEDNSGTFNIFGGYQVNAYLAAEASFNLLGAYEGEIATADIDNSYSALTLSLIGRMPLGGGLSVFAQVGGGVASIYQVVDGVVGSYYYDDDDASSSGFATVWGVGLSYLIPNYNAVEIRAGYHQTAFEVDAYAVDGLGNLVENEYDQTIEQFYVGAAYHF
jgi:OOP family OmpA-OmpF porin